jgi:hypothetical protein
LALRRLLVEIQLNPATFLVVPGPHSETRFNFRFKKTIELGKEPLHLPDITYHGGSPLDNIRMAKEPPKGKSVQKD